MDFNSFEQWAAEGSKDLDTRGRERARALLAAYEPPRMDEGVADAIADFVARRERELPDGVN